MGAAQLTDPLAAATTPESFLRCEVIGGATLYLADTLELLPKLAPADHIITDPPYEDELHSAMGRIQRTDGQEMVQELGFEGVNEFRAEFAEAMVAASKGWIIAFTLAEGVRAWRDDLQAASAKYDTCLFWVKPDASPRFNGQGAARGAECMVTAWAGKGYRAWNGGGKRGVYTHLVNPPGRLSSKRGGHPTEKPLSLMSALVSDFTKPGEVVLDPFMGSGSTGVAALRLGRRFVGIERDPKWFDLAVARLRAEQEALEGQGDLFAYEKPKQTTMFELLKPEGSVAEPISRLPREPAPEPVLEDAPVVEATVDLEVLIAQAKEEVIRVTALEFIGVGAQVWVRPDETGRLVGSKATGENANAIAMSSFFGGLAMAFDAKKGHLHKVV